MKKLFSLILIIFFFFISSETVRSEEEVNVQKLRAGAFVKVMPLEEISTLTADIDDEVKFINIQDLYVYETNAIPEGTIFYGEI